MQLVVVMAVRKAVRAATITFTAISMIRFFIRHLLPLVLIETVATITATAGAVTVSVTVAGTAAAG